MTGDFIIPASEVAPQSGGSGEYPEGTFRGRLVAPTTDRVRIRTLADIQSTSPGLLNPENPGATGDLTSIAVWLRADEVLEGTGQPGAQIHFHDIVVEDGQYSIADLSNGAGDGAGWLIKRDARNYARLAIALGAVEPFEQDGETFYRVPEGFVQALAEGQFDDREVVFEVRHNKKGRAYTASFSATS